MFSASKFSDCEAIRGWEETPVKSWTNDSWNWSKTFFFNKPEEDQRYHVSPEVGNCRSWLVLRNYFCLFWKQFCVWMLRQLVQASFPPSNTWNDKWSTSTVVPNNFPPLTDQTCTTDTISCRSSLCCSLLTRQHNNMVYQYLVWRMLCRSSRPLLHSEDVKPRVHCRCCRLLSSAAAMIMLETRWRKWFIALVTSDCCQQIWVFSGKTQLTAITELFSWLEICLSWELNTFFFSGIVCVVVIVEFLSDIVFFIVWLVHNKWLRRWVSCNVTTILRARDGGDGPGPYQQLPADTSLESSLRVGNCGVMRVLELPDRVYSEQCLYNQCTTLDLGTERRKVRYLGSVWNILYNS